MKFTDKILPDGEYYKEIIEKDTIFLHHTAGSHRPDWSIDGWSFDKNKTGGKLAVGTAYVIGGISTTNNDVSFDGKIYRAFDDKYWAHHLGLSVINNKILNQKSIGIEICNYGPVTKNQNGIFFNYVKKPVPANMVIELEKPFRGFNFWQKYTDKQLASTKALILDIALRHPKIDLRGGLRQFIHQGAAAFELNGGGTKGVSGIWSHSNVRADKLDIFPQPQIIELIKSL
jgi:hypothetical protein